MLCLSDCVSITIEVPKSIRIPPEEIERRIKLELALSLYAKGIATFAQARRIAGLSRWEFLEELGKAGIPIRYDLEELEKDIKVVEEIISEGRIKRHNDNSPSKDMSS